MESNTHIDDTTILVRYPLTPPTHAYIYFRSGCQNDLSRYKRKSCVMSRQQVFLPEMSARPRL